MNVVLTLDRKMLDKLFLKFNKYKKASKNQYITFYAKLPKATISVYNSGKVVFQGEEAENIAHQFGYTTTVRPKQQASIIGTDEVGNGSYFGPLVVVASFISDKDVLFLKNLGVADSKKLNDNKICQIAPQLMAHILHVPLIVEPMKYNNVISSGHNAVSIKVALHNQAIYLLEQHVSEPIEHIIIDAFTSEKNYQKYLSAEKNQVAGKVTLLTKAEDQFLAVACSSIIARYLFLKNLEALSLESGIQLPSGAGENSDCVAAKIIRHSGLESLEKYAKLHFANTKKAINLAQIIES
ncbi:MULTISPECIES: ribonuclease HIII [Lactococcus]|uniref:ribonuclease HIII n=1 Tax=Lactococcus TaxID=1357 RepID=UPI000EC73A75|nr:MULTISPECIES: ribonuclease HIII [Lactococcus]MBL3717064.1 ribonuclease HIII [Lactococcus garvieae]HAP15829.1 ribonuclease HIII [Lactococcus sp.]